ncbi:MAG: GDSL-type esterase/lipase family protein, partial [Acidimicrobiales bacterium]
MSARPEQPEPFIRGCLYPGLSGVAYPRANPSESEHLPSDVWQAAQLPVGVRLEIVGEAQGVRIHYRTTTANFGYRGEGAGCTFSMYRSGQKIAEEEAVLGNGIVQLPLTGEPGRPAVVYLPEGMRPIITGIEGIGGVIAPALRQPRWLCFGDAITQGWLASSPAGAWPAVTARKLGLDLCNLGYSGAGRQDPASGLSLAETPAELVTISLGSNSWARFPHTPALCAEEVRALITLVRSGHRDAPIVVMSPLLRPDGEDAPNRLGATLTELRIAMEEAVRERMMAGDVRLHLVEGSTIIGQSELVDGIYPGDDGHIRIAAAIGKVLSPQMVEIRERAEARWAAEAAASMQLDISQLPSTDFLRQVETSALGPIPSLGTVADPRHTMGSGAPAGLVAPIPSLPTVPSVPARPSHP